MTEYLLSVNIKPYPFGDSTLAMLSFAAKNAHNVFGWETPGDVSFRCFVQSWTTPMHKCFKFKQPSCECLTSNCDRIPQIYRVFFSLESHLAEWKMCHNGSYSLHTISTSSRAPGGHTLLMSDGDDSGSSCQFPLK